MNAGSQLGSAARMTALSRSVAATGDMRHHTGCAHRPGTVAYFAAASDINECIRLYIGANHRMPVAEFARDVG